MNLSTRRWIVLLFGLLANLCQGVAYTSSIFMLPLGEALGRPHGEWSREWGLIFAMTLAFLPVGMILSGKLADLGKTWLTVGVGAVLFGGGLILASYGTSVMWVALTLGMMTSIGSGCAYGTVIGSMVRWFPDRRGLASGLAVAAVGIGPMVLAPIASRLIGPYGVMGMFKILGIATLLIMGLAAFIVKNPPAGYAPAGWTPPQTVAGQAPAGSVNLDWKQMITRPLFWLLWITYFCGVFAGILINGLAAPIAIELAGFSRDQAALPVMLFAFASAGGRVLWGFLSDIFGRMPMIIAAFVLTALAMLVLYGWVAVPGFYLPCLFTAGLCYGGIFGTFPSLSADSFGIKNAAMNLAVLFSSFSLVALLAPQVVGMYRTGGAEEYPKAFLVAGCIAAAGLILSIIVGRTITQAKRNGGEKA